MEPFRKIIKGNNLVPILIAVGGVGVCFIKNESNVILGGPGLFCPFPVPFWPGFITIVQAQRTGLNFF